MRYLFKIINLFSLCLFFCAFTDLNDKHVGKWIGEDKGSFGYLILDEDGFASFEIKGKSYGGKESIRNGKKVKMSYIINYSTKPIYIDFIISEIGTNSIQIKFTGIIQFKTENKMKIALQFNPNLERPSSFNDKSTFVVDLSKASR